MKILSLEEGKQWLAAKSCQCIVDDEFEEEFGHRICYHLPVDTGKKTGMAAMFSRLFIGKNESMLWIKGWSAFPSRVNMDLFEVYRKSFNEQRPLIEAPFHLFLESDSKALQSLLGLCLYFYWDSVLLDSERNLVLTTSNDEFIDVYTRTQEQLEAVKNMIGLEPAV